MKRANAKFRSRKIDPRRLLPVYLASQLKEISDASTVGRALAEVSTGVEKDEEKEHHLQAAISSYTAAYVSDSSLQADQSSLASGQNVSNKFENLYFGKQDCDISTEVQKKPIIDMPQDTMNSVKKESQKNTSLIYIPTPYSNEVISSEIYERLYPANYARPTSKIRFTASVEDSIGCPYNVDELDETFISSTEYPVGLSCDSFERIMHALEELANEKTLSFRRTSIQPLDSYFFALPSLEESRSSIFHNPNSLASMKLWPESESLGTDWLPSDLGSLVHPSLEEFLNPVYDWWVRRRVARGYQPIINALAAEEAQQIPLSLGAICTPTPLSIRNSYTATIPQVQSTTKTIADPRSEQNLSSSSLLVKIPSAVFGSVRKASLQSRTVAIPKSLVLHPNQTPVQETLQVNPNVTSNDISENFVTPSASLLQNNLIGIAKVASVPRQENDPYVCFRKRDVKLIRKTRRTEAQANGLLIRFRRDLELLRALAVLIYRRETLRLEYITSEKQAFDCRVKLQTLRSNLPRSEVSGEANWDPPDHQLYFHESMMLYIPFVPEQQPKQENISSLASSSGTFQNTPFKFLLHSNNSGSVAGQFSSRVAQSTLNSSENNFSPCLRKSNPEFTNQQGHHQYSNLSPQTIQRNLNYRNSSLKRSIASSNNFNYSSLSMRIASSTGHSNLVNDTLPMLAEVGSSRKRVHMEELPSLGEIMKKKTEEFISQRLIAYQDYINLTLGQKSSPFSNQPIQEVLAKNTSIDTFSAPSSNNLNFRQLRFCHGRKLFCSG